MRVYYNLQVILGGCRLLGIGVVVVVWLVCMEGGLGGGVYNGWKRWRGVVKWCMFRRVGWVRGMFG